MICNVLLTLIQQSPFDRHRPSQHIPHICLITIQIPVYSLGTPRKGQVLQWDRSSNSNPNGGWCEYLSLCSEKCFHDMPSLVVTTCWHWHCLNMYCTNVLWEPKVPFTVHRQWAGVEAEMNMPCDCVLSTSGSDADCKAAVRSWVSIGIMSHPWLPNASVTLAPECNFSCSCLQYYWAQSPSMCYLNSRCK